MSVQINTLRALLFYLTLTLWTVSWSTVMMIIIPFLPFRLRHPLLVKNWAHVAMFLCRFIAGIRWEVHGRENIPEKPCVLVSNHQSSWETFFIQTLFSPQTQVIKQSLLNIPFFGWAFRLIKPIAIDRDDPRKSLSQIAQQGSLALKNDVWVLIFPEGTRFPDGELGKFSKGGVNLARKAESDILPIAHNAGTCWPNGQILKKPGTIHVHIGPVISTTEKTPAAANNEVREWIAGALEAMK
ncbi:MAG: lysophospholipid acyltransferase family protein [Endozoicomonas sp.]